MALRERGKRGLGVIFGALQRAGVDVLPRHFYSSIPDIEHLRSEDRWRHERSMVGIEGADVAQQLSFVRSLLTPEVSARLGGRDIHERACTQNGTFGYGPVEADCLYAFVHTKRPQKIVQIGAGVSTSVILTAARDARYAPDLVAIDPYPTAFIREAPVTLIEDDAQDVPVEQLTALSAGDLLFVDSTHTVKVDSEVNLLVLEVLPRLAPGVWVHFHDVYFPYDYQRDILNPPLFFWTESTLLHALLIGNRNFRIAASLSMLHYGAPQEVQQLIPRYTPEPNEHGLGTRVPRGHFPSSLYLLRTEAPASA